MFEKVKVSIIVPVYNAAKSLERTMPSLLKQTLQEVEIILVDDCSSDNSSELCELLAKEHAHKIKLYRHNEQKGPGAARNTGIQHARGEFLGFVDSDDIASPEMFQKLYEAAVLNQAQVSVCGYTYKSKHKEVVTVPQNTESLFSLNRKTFSNVWNKLFSASFIRLHDIKFPHTSCAEDMAFVFKCALRRPKLAVVQESLYTYLHNFGSVSFNMNKRYAVLDSFKDIYQYVMEKKMGNAWLFPFLKISLLHLYYYPTRLFFASFSSQPLKKNFVYNYLKYLNSATLFVLSIFGRYLSSVFKGA